ncbi:MAG TPA: hypothetical protein DCZ94_19865 [Lentisphaeria bacterium]|nr:MAG: hypothetical protein A2X48_22300 [Lentisphaerae bacterium GWF2_49_21]HBC89203.1 hypothetical protein [Lentisphaeria bacterium]
MKKILDIIIAIVSLCLLSSCALGPLDTEKIFDLKPGEKLYTAHNMWADGNNEITHLNYRQGRLLPFGTEVDIIEAYNNEILIKDIRTNEQFKLKAMKKTLVLRPVEHFRRLFTKKTPEKLVEGINPEVLGKIRQGVIEKGMTRNEVILSYGYPPPHRNPDINESSWIYFENETDTDRVIFNKKGILIDIIKHEHNEVKK